ncbi:hypothetical protein HDU96_009185 [Phlyctochytrium bullatum]|nr:hypothetical protein HDU96_009185 [Phlyctochytrium bullatum]
MVFGLFSGPAFSVDKIPSLDGKVAIVTGASSGLGEVSALELAAKNAHVSLLTTPTLPRPSATRSILACRSPAKADATVNLIKGKVPSAKLDVMELDLADLSSVKKFATEFKAKKLPLHILMNNAGIMAVPEFTLSKNDIEIQFASNVVGHFYLTNLLLPVLEDTAKKGADVRIVNLSSSAHALTPKDGIDFDNLNNPATYSPWYAYGQTKLGNILHTRALQSRLDAKGLNIHVNAVHPGVVHTNLQTGASLIPNFMLPYLGYLGFVTPQFGALTQLYCATSPEIVEKGYKGKFFVPTAQVATPSKFAQDEALAEKLWTWCEETLTAKGFGY